MAVMTNKELAAKLKDVATNYKTLYVMGCFGAPMTEANKTRYCNNHSYNKKAARTAMIKAASADTFGFDCVCLIKGILWGWNGNKNATYGGAKYASNGVPDIGADSMITKCSELSTNFNDIEVGEAVWMSGHIGVYIGDGLAVECTPSWDNKVQITACNCTKSGYKRRNWTKHGKLPYIEYVKETVIARLTRDQVDMIWKKGKVVSQFEPVKVSDCIETLNHCVCVDYIIDHAMEPITQKFIKKLHCLLMAGSVDERLKKVVPGEFRPNEYKVTGRELPPACTIPGSLREIINEYEEIPDTQLGDILNFHVEFEMIAPFQDGNGRIGRLIMFKECLRHDIMPFIIDDKRRSRYHEGIRKWSGRRKALTTVVNEVQEYFERQINLHRLLASGQDISDGRYECASGHRRRKAAELAGLL